MKLHVQVLDRVIFWQCGHLLPLVPVSLSVAKKEGTRNAILLKGRNKNRSALNPLAFALLQGLGNFSILLGQT
jgi:hypothetical protein